MGQPTTSLGHGRAIRELVRKLYCLTYYLLHDNICAQRMFFQHIDRNVIFPIGSEIADRVLR